MATHSSILAWRIPWAEEPGRLQPMGLQRVRHDWVINIFTFTLVIILRREADGTIKGQSDWRFISMDPNSKMRIAGQLRKKAGFYPDHIFFILKVRIPPWLHLYRKACRPKGDQCQGMFYSDAFLVKSILSKRGMPIHGRISLPQPDLSLWLGTQALLNPL